MNRKTLQYVLLGVLALAIGEASAAISTTEALASIADAETAITAVGAGLIGLAAVVMALKWVKAMFF